jgi:hypothetical protein
LGFGSPNALKRHPPLLVETPPAGSDGRLAGSRFLAH